MPCMYSKNLPCFEWNICIQFLPLLIIEAIRIEIVLFSIINNQIEIWIMHSTSINYFRRNWATHSHLIPFQLHIFLNIIKFIFFITQDAEFHTARNTAVFLIFDLIKLVNKPLYKFLPKSIIIISLKLKVVWFAISLIVYRF